MSSQRIQTLILDGEESLRFAQSIFMPTAEQIDRFRRFADIIERSITINETSDGFEAVIPDFELSIGNEDHNSVMYKIDISNEISLPVLSNTSTYKTFFEAFLSALIDPSIPMAFNDPETHAINYNVCEKRDYQSMTSSETSALIAA